MPDMDLHPIAVATLEAIAASGQTPFHMGTPQQARADVAARLSAMPPRPHPDIASIEDLTLPGPAGPLAARRYQPSAVSGPGAIVYAHGGGWVFGAPDLFDPLCSWLAVAARRPLVSIDYRLAPETRFPGPLDDMVAAVEAVSEAEGQVVVAGDSAGGNLAAAAALVLADRGDSPIAGQILLYPVLDHDFGTPSYRDMGDAGRIISTADMRWFWDQYLSDAAERDDPRASPLRAPRLDHLPPAYIAVAGWDPLRDEGIRFAERLREAGVAVDLDERGDMIHGFCSQAGLLDRADAVLARAGALAEQWLTTKNRPPRAE
jgi:acetyl esterase